MCIEQYNRGAFRIAHGVVDEYVCRRITAIRSSPYTRIAVFTALNDRYMTVRSGSGSTRDKNSQIFDHFAIKNLKKPTPKYFKSLNQADRCAHKYFREKTFSPL